MNPVVSSVDSCQLSASWEADEGLQTVTRYSVSPPAGSLCHNQNMSDPDLTTILDHPVCIRRPKKPHQSPCKLVVWVRPQHHAIIQGMEICSESRIVEVYDETDFYLLTLRGETADKTPPQNNGNESYKFYKCMFVLEKPEKAVHIKFLSLGDRDSFHILYLDVQLSSYGETLVTEACISKQINMKKVKELMDGLGGHVSDNAKTLLNAIDHYQKNQNLLFPEDSSLLTPPLVSDKSWSPLLNKAGLLSNFFRMNFWRETDEDQDNKNHDFIQEDGLSLKLNVGKGEDVKKMELYNGLQDICSEVSKFRGFRKKIVYRNNISMGSNNSAESASKIDCSTFLPKLEEMFQKHIKVFEDRLQQTVSVKLAEMEQRMDKKLDLILQHVSFNPVQMMAVSGEEVTRSEQGFGQ